MATENDPLAGLWKSLGPDLQRQLTVPLPYTAPETTVAPTSPQLLLGERTFVVEADYTSNLLRRVYAAGFRVSDRHLCLFEYSQPTTLANQLNGWGRVVFQLAWLLNPPIEGTDIIRHVESGALAVGMHPVEFKDLAIFCLAEPREPAQIPIAALWTPYYAPLRGRSRLSGMPSYPAFGWADGVEVRLVLQSQLKNQAYFLARPA